MFFAEKTLLSFFLWTSTKSNCYEPKWKWLINNWLILLKLVTKRNTKRKKIMYKIEVFISRYQRRVANVNQVHVKSFKKIRKSQFFFFIFCFKQLSCVELSNNRDIWRLFVEILNHENMTLRQKLYTIADYNFWCWFLITTFSSRNNTTENTIVKSYKTSSNLFVKIFVYNCINISSFSNATNVFRIVTFFTCVITINFERKSLTMTRRFLNRIFWCNFNL